MCYQNIISYIVYKKYHLQTQFKRLSKNNFISFWREERTSSLGLNEGKLTTFYKIKETFSREFYLDSRCFKELFKYGKLLHKICISFTKRHLSLMYKGHSNKIPYQDYKISIFSVPAVDFFYLNSLVVKTVTVHLLKLT
jgi:hypothetical protein